MYKLNTMKKLLILLIIITLSCKKKNTTPSDSDPATTTTGAPVDNCKKSDSVFVGKYTFYSDTIEVRFLYSNCPTNNSNTYIVKGLGQAMQPYAKPETPFPIKTYTLTVDELTGTSYNTEGVSGTPSFVSFNFKRKVINSYIMLEFTCTLTGTTITDCFKIK